MEPGLTDTTQVDAVVIGASAGGVEAIGVLLEALPERLAAPVIVVLHIPAQRVSMLAQVFSRHCVLPVKEAEDKETVAPGTVYIAPPDYHLLVEPDKSFVLSADEAVNFSRPSIDLLFESAAYAYRDRLLGIILTGGSGDGAAGLQTIRVCGGAAWVQDPAQAQSSMMPAMAIRQAGADRILALKDMAILLSRIGTSTGTASERSPLS